MIIMLKWLIYCPAENDQSSGITRWKPVFTIAGGLASVVSPLSSLLDMCLRLIVTYSKSILSFCFTNGCLIRSGMKM